MLRLLKNLSLCAVLAFLVACGGGKLSEKLPAELQADYDWIKETKTTLDQKRADFSALEEQIDNYKPDAVAPEGEETETPAPTLEELKAQYDTQKKEIGQLTTDFQTKLQDFLYALEIEFNKVQKKNPNLNPRKEYIEANHMFTGETMVVCKEWVDKQGDYKKAIDTLEETLKTDPDNTEAKAFLDQLKVDQYMTPERLAQITRGMTEKDVAKTIGMVYRNFKETWPEQKTMAWFYPREDTGVAGVYFIQGADGAFTVFKTNYDAKKPKTEEETSEQ